MPFPAYHISLDLISCNALQKQPLLTCRSVPCAGKQNQSGIEFISNNVNVPSNGIDVGEIDPSSLAYEKKIVSVSFCDL